MDSAGMEEITAFIEKMKFSRKLFGGVDELDVLRQMEELQKLYRSVYERRVAYDRALLDEKDAVIRKLKCNEKESTETAAG